MISQQAWQLMQDRPYAWNESQNIDSRLRRLFSWGIPCLALGLLLTGSPNGAAAESQLDKILTQFESDSFQARWTAQRSLALLAKDHLIELEELALSRDPDTAERIIEALESVFLKDDGRVGEHAEQILQRLARAGGSASVAAGLVLQGNARVRESRARRALEKLGAQFVYFSPFAAANGQAIFGMKAAVLPEVGVEFGPAAVLHSIYLHEDWSGTKEDLWHLTRLENQRDLAIYSIQGNSIDLNELFLLARSLRGLTIQERGACLGIRSEPFTTLCVVGTVVKGGAADTAGLVNGDIVVQLNETMIRNFPHLIQSLQSYKIGDEVTFAIFRNGAPLEIKVRLGSWRDAARQDELSVESPPHFEGPFASPAISDASSEKVEEPKQTDDPNATASESSVNP